MSYYRAVDSSQNDFLKHYGVKGMKWGIRRFQNESNKDHYKTRHSLYNEAKNDAKIYRQSLKYRGSGSEIKRHFVKRAITEKQNRNETYSKHFNGDSASSRSPSKRSNYRIKVAATVASAAFATYLLGKNSKIMDVAKVYCGSKQGIVSRIAKNMQGQLFVNSILNS